MAAKLMLSPQIILITGLMASGKSTVAQHLAERLSKSVHLRGDVFRRMIVSGRAEIGYELSEEAHEQLFLRYQIAAGVAVQYFQAGFTVVYQDIVIGPDLTQVVSLYGGYSLSVFVLCPTPAVVAAREVARGKRGYRAQEEINEFDRVLRAQTPKIGYWLDNSHLTIPETVQVLLSRLPKENRTGAT